MSLNKHASTSNGGTARGELPPVTSFLSFLKMDNRLQVLAESPVPSCQPNRALSYLPLLCLILHSEKSTKKCPFSATQLCSSGTYPPHGLQQSVKIISFLYRPQSPAFPSRILLSLTLFSPDSHLRVPIKNIYKSNFVSPFSPSF